MLNLTVRGAARARTHARTLSLSLSLSLLKIVDFLTLVILSLFIGISSLHGMYLYSGLCSVITFIVIIDTRKILYDFILHHIGSQKQAAGFIVYGGLQIYVLLICVLVSSIPLIFKMCL
jgi:hypothetical protein